MIVQLTPETIPLSRKLQSLCRYPYRRHPRGCPNYAKKSGCPPRQPLINKILDFSKEIYLIYTEFDLGNHIRKIKTLYPHWSEYQIYCVLYWQSHARKIQRQEEEKATQNYQFDFICRSPEANGVNITELMKNLGVILEWPPRKITRLISLAGWKLK
ncbi:MAG: hypothetical protein WC523_07700 [Patescibacteria group bacterium]